jgi:hypothetical protein
VDQDEPHDAGRYRGIRSVDQVTSLRLPFTNGPPASTAAPSPIANFHPYPFIDVNALG